MNARGAPTPTEMGSVSAEGDSFAGLGEDAIRAIALHTSRAVDEERTRIARGLHDDVGQILAAIQLRLAQLKRAGSADAERSLTTTIDRLVADAFESTRSLTFELMAPMAAEIGIEAELESVTTRITHQFGISYRFESDGRHKPMGPAEAANMLSAVSELLVNVGKHSQAEKVTVSVLKKRDRIQVEVHDNGVGFVPNARPASSSGGLGLLILRDRLAEIGGDLAIESEPGAGSHIVITAPLLESC